MNPPPPFLPFASPLIEEDEIQEVVASLKSGWLGTGPKVARFQEDFAAYKEVDEAVAVGSCTAALHLSLIASNIKEGDEVITTPMTFCATINAIIHAGAAPVLADIDEKTMNINPREVEKKITPRTKAILPVHFAGRACDMQALNQICSEHDLIMIEDCAHAIETESQGVKAGTWGDFGCFSFYVTKNLVTGEGGMVISKDKQALERVKRLSLHGMSKHAWNRFGKTGFQHYYVEEAGFKYNMTDIQAALGIHQLAKIEKHWRRRKEIWDRYNHELVDLPISLPAPIGAHERHAHHLYTILVDEKRTGISRDEFLNRMIQENIGLGVHYLSIPEHPYYQKQFGWSPHDYPCAHKIGQQSVSLPLSAKLSDDDLSYVLEKIKEVLS